METARSVESEATGKYRPIADLGEGGTASVFLAVARGPNDFNKLVVLKMLKRELCEESEFRQMFLREARLSARLNHPNVVQTYEVLEVNGRPIIVMEYLEGQALSRVVSRAREGGTAFPLAMQLRIMAEGLTGLHYAHELKDYTGAPMGVVHRDVSPQNLFVSYDGRVCLLDFGIAKLSSGAREAQTAVGMVKGKLRYMPAEQLLGAAVDRRADIYAAGVMIWEAATGAKMWHGLAEPTIMQRVACGDTPSPRSVNPEVSEVLERICMKALAHHPEDRYQTAAELQADLEQFVDDSPYTPRAIGKFLEGLFSEDRTRVKLLVESQLSATDAQATSLDQMSDSAQWGFLPATDAARTEPEFSPTADTKVTELAGASQRPAAPRDDGWRWRIGFLAVALAALAWRFVPLSYATSTPSVAAHPEGAKAASAAARAEAPPQEIQLRVSVLPASAKIYIDDQPVPTNPYSAVLARSANTHVLRAEAPGHAPEVRSIDYQANLSLELMLATLPEESRADAEPRTAKRRRARAAAAAESTPASDVCAIPYYVDADGIRRLKRECLK
jgi:serine/threonine protein kinase